MGRRGWKRVDGWMGRHKVAEERMSSDDLTGRGATANGGLVEEGMVVRCRQQYMKVKRASGGCRLSLFSVYSYHGETVTGE